MKRILIPVVMTLVGFSPQDGEVKKLIERLSSDEVREREQASRELVRMGRRSLEALREAEKSASLDVRSRARELIADIDWPEPGDPVNGLALAIKADSEYAKESRLLVRGRLINRSDNDLAVAGAHSEGISEGGALHLRLDGGKDLYHLCYRRHEPGPDLPARFTLKKGEWRQFTFSPRAWCGQIEHSKCAPFAIETPVTYRIALVLILSNKANGEWNGRVESNEASFRLN
jgi:hypothetical protein